MTPDNEQGTGDTAAPAAAADGAPVWQLGLRDLALALAALSLWAAADAWYGATGLRLAALLSLLDGLLVGAALTFLAHEWGHFAGARLSGGIAPTRSLRSVFPLFEFDMERGSVAAFRGMGIGGNLAHWALVLGLALALPLETPGRVALVCGAFGFAVFASTTEIPVIRSSYAGASNAGSFAGLTPDALRRNGWIGAGAALGLLVLL